MQVLIDGPCTGVPRQALRINQLHLTKFNIKFPYLASTRVVRKAWADGKVDEKWAESMWAKKLAAKKAVSIFIINIEGVLSKLSYILQFYFSAQIWVILIALN